MSRFYVKIHHTKKKRKEKHGSPFRLLDIGGGMEAAGRGRRHWRLGIKSSLMAPIVEPL